MRLAAVTFTTLTLLSLTACGGRKHFNASLNGDFEGSASETHTFVTRVDAPRNAELPYRVADLLDRATDVPHPRDLAYRTLDDAAADIAHFIVDTDDDQPPARDPDALDLGSS